MPDASLLGWQSGRQDTATWYVPAGQITEQCGERRTDVLLVWADDSSEQIDETQIRQQWPGCQESRRLAPNLFLVMGVESADAEQAAAPVPPETTACALANRLQAKARQCSDAAELAAALTDMAIVIRKKGDPAKAVTLLREALTLTRQLGNLAREMDVLGNLGLAHLKLGNAAAALLRTGAGNGLGSPAEIAAGAGPGLLRMAIAAAKSLAKQVGSGLKTVSPQTYQRRVQTCVGCEPFTGVRCRVCGCFTQIKARLPHERCPLEKWPA